MSCHKYPLDLMDDWAKSEQMQMWTARRRATKKAFLRLRFTNRHKDTDLKAKYFGHQMCEESIFISIALWHISFHLQIELQWCHSLMKWCSTRLERISGVRVREVPWMEFLYFSSSSNHQSRFSGTKYDQISTFNGGKSAVLKLYSFQQKVNFTVSHPVR